MFHRIQLKSQIRLQLAVAVIGLFTAMISVPLIKAQERSETTAEASRAQKNKSQPVGTQTKQEEQLFPEVEFVASNDFQNFNMVVPVFRGINIEGHYFGVRAEPEAEEGEEQSFERPTGIIDTGVIGGSYSFRLGEHITLTPGLGVYFGEGQKTSPAIIFRWDIEKGKLVSQGLFIQALEASEEFGRPTIWDGNHVSLRLDRLEFGPSWELIHTRSENEWKGGGRAAFRILPNLSLVLYVLAPNTEFRGGFILHPER
jgi:hypothetical protein